MFPKPGSSKNTSETLELATSPPIKPAYLTGPPINTFITENFADTFESDVFVNLCKDHKAELEQYEIYSDEELIKSQQVLKYIKENLIKLKAMKKDITKSTTSKSITNYIVTASLLAMLPESESYEPDLVTKLKDVVNHLYKTLPNAKFHVLKGRNCLAGVYIRCGVAYQAQAKENLELTKALLFQVNILYEDEGLKAALQTWLNWNDDLFKEERRAAFLSMLRNRYAYAVAYESDEDVVTHGLKYIHEVAKLQNRFSGILTSTYLAITSCSYDVARKCIELKRLAQAEHCLAFADAVVHRKFEPKITNVGSHMYMKALVNLGYRLLLLSWVKHGLEKTELIWSKTELNIDGLRETPPTYRLPCEKVKDAQQYIQEFRNRDRDEDKNRIPEGESDFRKLNKLYNEVNAIIDVAATVADTTL